MSVLADGGFTDVELAEVSHPMWLGHDLDDAVGYMEGQPIARIMSDGKPPEAVAGRAGRRCGPPSHPTSPPTACPCPGTAWLVTARAA